MVRENRVRDCLRGGRLDTRAAPPLNDCWEEIVACKYFLFCLGFDFYVGSAGGEGSKRRYIYKSTAMKKYGLTRA
jgi:hypothetical protein